MVDYLGVGKLHPDPWGINKTFELYIGIISSGFVVIIIAVFISIFGKDVWNLQ